MHDSLFRGNLETSHYLHQEQSLYHTYYSLSGSLLHVWTLLSCLYQTALQSHSTAVLSLYQLFAFAAYRQPQKHQMSFLDNLAEELLKQYQLLYYLPYTKG